MMTLGEGEPAAGPWTVESLDDFARQVIEAAGAPTGRPAIVAVDGRSSSGKTTLSGRLARLLPDACVVHTDDIAWWHSAFVWSDLLVTGVLEPLHRGTEVRFRPPAWDTRERSGAIEVPADAAYVIVEGVGAGRREVAHLVDATVWVQSDLAQIERRNDVRVAAGEISPSNYASWMREEFPFVADQRAWERAFVIATGTSDLPHDPDTQVMLAPLPSHP